MERASRIDMILSMLEKEPDDLFLNYSLGLEHVSHKSFDLAEASFKKTLSIQADYVPVFYQLGKMFEALGKNETALAYFREGLEHAKEQKNNKAMNEFGEAIFMLED